MKMTTAKFEEYVNKNDQILFWAEIDETGVTAMVGGSRCDSNSCYTQVLEKCQQYSKVRLSAKDYKNEAITGGFFGYEFDRLVKVLEEQQATEWIDEAQDTGMEFGDYVD